MVEPLFGPRASITLRREYPASVETLWNAWTDPEVFAQWVWGGIGRDPVAAVDPRPGGLYSAYTHVEESHGWRSNRWGVWGVFLDVVPHRKLVYTLHWDGPVGYNQTGAPVLDEGVVVTFEPTAAGTAIELHHHGIPDDGVAAPEHEKGIQLMLECLARVIEQPKHSGR